MGQVPASEIERWNRIYQEEPDRIRWEPNGFLVSVVGTLKPGDALDVAMGQGRNSLFLAREGWNVTGFDLSEVGVKRALARAKEQNVKLTATVADLQAFDYGQERFDLIVLAYVGNIKGIEQRLQAALRPGGSLVIEHFAGGFDPGSLPILFGSLQAVQHSVEDGYPDFSRNNLAKVERFWARRMR
jgi:2-polyprenyl-3-methyl-5-hydroxy-6-metoxy-1,4-benzoquinol methylase